MSSGSTFELYGKYKDLYLFNTGRGSVLFKALSYDKCETAKRICKNYPALAPVIEDDIWREYEPVDTRVINEGKEHIERFDEWLDDCEQNGYDIEFVAW